MGIFDRLGNVINSYLNDFGRDTSGSFRRGDPDLDAAYDELNDYLNRKDKKPEYTWKDPKQEEKTNASPKKAALPPEELRADFECLGVPFGADTETCKTAYKKLLKIHHPDHHAGHEGNFKKATEKSAKINAAWDRICNYYQTNAS